MISILTVALVLAIACAAYFGINAKKYSSQVLDKEMVINALRAQSESDKIKISELQTSSTSSRLVSNDQIPSTKRRKPRQPKQA